MQAELADKFAALLPLITPGPMEVVGVSVVYDAHDTPIAEFCCWRRREAEANAAFYALCSTHAAEIEAALREAGK